MSRRSFFIVDSSVLIDFCNSDLNILGITSRSYATVHVPINVLAEVMETDRASLEKIGVIVVDPKLDLLHEAVLRARNHPLTSTDWTCVLLARKHSWCCVTNDRRLARECESQGVAVRRGFGLLLDLAKQSVISKERARSSAEKMHTSNRAYLTKEVLEDFFRKLGP